MVDRFVIQHIILPGTRMEGVDGMYYHSERSFSGWPVQLHPRDRIDLSAFYNLLPLRKWRENTDVGDILLEINIEGDAVVTLNGYSDDGSVSDTAVKRICSNGRSVIDFPVPIGGDVVGVIIDSESDATLYRVDFVSSRPDCMAKVGVIMCTYRREEWVLANIKAVLGCLDDVGGDFSVSVQMIVVDNSGDLCGIPDDPRVEVHRNINTGGSGGYARGMMESGDRGFTHIVLMDDDVILEPESLYRLWSFASFMGSGRRCAVGGIMVRTDRPTEVHESTARMTDWWLDSNDQGTDLSMLQGCISLDREKECNYSGWWFCMYPASVANPENLPLPLFLFLDDVEFGIRSNMPILTLTGISVWHQPFDTKYSASREYYSVRNGMIVRAMHGRLTIKSLLFFNMWLANRTFHYRYNDAEAVLKGMEDFLKGPEFITSLDMEALNTEITGWSEKLVDMTDVIEFSAPPYPDESRGVVNDIIRVITLNGLFLPERGTVPSPIHGGDPFTVQRAGSVANMLCDTGKGFVTRRDVWSSIRIFSKLLIFDVKCLVSVRRIDREYSEKAEEMRSPEKWKRILRLNREG